MRASLLSTLVLGIALVLAPIQTTAEIYKWVDAKGRLNFAADLHQVPEQYRQQASDQARNAPPPGREIQTYEPSSAPAAVAPSTRGRMGSRTKAGSKSDEVYKIRVEQVGNMMRVDVVLNDSVTAPFYIDTGASDISVPKWVADKLRLDTSESRTAVYGTANGSVTKKLITLDSVAVGGARVEGVPASISESMTVGLLGLSYFNRFNYEVNPAKGIVTLRPNGLAEEGILRGGKSEGQWRNDFRQLEMRLEAIDEMAGEISIPDRQRKRVVAAQQETARQLEVLEDEANRAGVPMNWRR